MSSPIVTKRDASRPSGVSFRVMSGEAPIVGRLLSCGVIGQGPSVLYDLVKQVKEWVGKVAA